MPRLCTLPAWRKEGICPKCKARTEWGGERTKGQALVLGCGCKVIGMDWQLEGRELAPLAELIQGLRRELTTTGREIGRELEVGLRGLADPDQMTVSLSRFEWWERVVRKWPSARGEWERGRLYLYRRLIEEWLRREARKERGEG